MMNRSSFASWLLVACLGIGCTEQSAPRYVEGTRATEGNLCDREFEYGHSCVRDGDRCADGGNTPASLQCILGTWHCVRDNRYFTCRAPSMTPSISIDLTPPAEATGQVIISCGIPQNQNVLTNSNNVHIRTLGIQAVDRSVRINRLRLQLGWSGVGFEHHVSAPSGESYFSNLRLVDLETAEVRMGPTTLTAMAERRLGTSLLQDRTVTVQHGTRQILGVQANVAARESVYQDLTGGYYALEFGGVRPLTIFTDDDLVYTDNNQSVPRENIVYDGSCFEAAEQHDFHVVPRFADLIPDLDNEVVSTSAVGTVSHVASLGMMCVNDGVEEGNLTNMVIEGHAQTELNLVLDLDDVVSACTLEDTSGNVVARAIPQGNRLAFQSFAARCVGRPNISRFRVYCDYHWPTMPSEAINESSFIEVRLGALYDQFRLSTTGDAGRVRGTSALDENRLPANMTAITVMLRPSGEP